MRQLGQLEAVVMARLWAATHPVLVRDVLEDLQQDRKIAYTTILTVMENLRRKGMVTRSKDGRAYRYQAWFSREQYTAAMMEEVLDSSENRQATLLHFIEQIPPHEAAQLRAALDGAVGGEPGA